MSNSPSSSPSGERREGPANRRMLERAPASDRRLANEHPKTLTSDDVHFRPPLEAGAADPPTENTQLLFERS